jgi:hypothetical protein
MLTRWIVFIKAHEVLILGLAVIGVVWYLGAKYEDSRGEKLIETNALIQQQLQTQVIQNQVLTGQLADQQAAYNILATKIVTQNAQIDAEMAAKQAQVTKQQQIDATLPLAGLAIRWRLIENLTPPDVIVADNNLSISGQAATKTVEDLEGVGPLHQEVLDDRRIQDNLTNQLTTLTSLSTSQTKEIEGLNLQITLAEKSCQDRIGLVKIQQRKRSGLWFKVGVVLGSVLTGIVLR